MKVKSKEIKVKSKITREYIEDLKMYYNIDLEDDMIEKFSEKLREELKPESQKVREMREKKLKRIMKKKNHK